MHCDAVKTSWPYTVVMCEIVTEVVEHLENPMLHDAHC